MSSLWRGRREWAHSALWMWRVMGPSLRLKLISKDASKTGAFFLISKDASKLRRLKVSELALLQGWGAGTLGRYASLPDTALSKALGNGVHRGVMMAILKTLFIAQGLLWYRDSFELVSVALPKRVRKSDVLIASLQTKHVFHCRVNDENFMCPSVWVSSFELACVRNHGQDWGQGSEIINHVQDRGQVESLTLVHSPGQ